jgi:hypothetical protein
MKKLISLPFIFFITITLVTAQIREQQGYENTLSTGIEQDLDAKNNDNRTAFRWQGFTDTFQARVDVSNLVIDTMLQWNADADYDADDNLSGLLFKYEDSDVNFIFTPVENLNLAMGTYLNWKVGPAPSHDADSWESGYHIAQGDLKSGNPGNEKVTGAAYYPNYYAIKALAARYTYKELLQIGTSIPDGTKTDDFAANVGVKLTPVERLALGFAYNGLFEKDGDIYFGGTFLITDAIKLDFYSAFDNIGGKSDNGITAFGAACKFNLKALTLRPESGFNFFEENDYTPAWYIGIKADYNLTSKMIIGAWTSYASGSRDESWDDSSASKNYIGGYIFNIRATFDYLYDRSNKFSAAFEYETLTSYLNTDYNFSKLGFYWTHLF